MKTKTPEEKAYYKKLKKTLKYLQNVPRKERTYETISITIQPIVDEYTDKIGALRMIKIFNKAIKKVGGNE